MLLLIIAIGIIVVIFCAVSLFGAPYVPSSAAEIRKAFKHLYELGDKDLLIDLGSGDGKVLRIADEFNAKSIGIEMNPILAAYSFLRTRKLPNAKIVCKNFYRYDFPDDTTIIYVFGDGRDIQKIANYVQKQAVRIGHPIFLMSHAFEVKDAPLIKQYRAYFLYKIDSKEKK